MSEPEHIVPLVPVQPTSPPGPRHPSPLVRVGIVTGTAALVLVGAVAAMGASPASSGSTTTPSTPSVSGDPNAGTVPGHWRGDLGGIGRGFAAITITGISGSDLSLETDDGWTRTITATSTTEITKAGAPITVDDLAVGDEIRFGQTKAADSTYTITRIVVVLPSLGGEVTAKTADTITVTQRDGTSATIHVDGATTYAVRGVEDATLDDIEVGMHVRAEGTENSDGSLDASRVASGFGGRGGHGPGDHDGPDGPKDASPDASPSPSATP